MNEHQWGFSFDPDACIQCLGCAAACKMWRRTENAIQWRRVVNIWNGDYPDVICSSLSLSCQHCTEPQCLDVCPVSAIYKNPDGLVLVDPEKCIGCQACFKACPYGVPQYGADGLMQKCDMCVDAADARPGGSDRPPCVATCPTHALALRKMTPSEKRQSQQTVLKALPQP